MSKKDTVSAPTIGTRVITASSCHVMRIKGYSQTKLLGRDAGAHSCVFEAAGQFWRISYYPNGDLLTLDSGSISLALDLIPSERSLPEGYVNAVARFTLLPHHHHGKQLAESAQPHNVRLSGKFCMKSERCFRFIKREELEKSEGYLVDDCFAVRCDIDVVKTWATGDRAQDVVEMTEARGLVWKSPTQQTQQQAAAWPFAGLGRFLHRLFAGFP